MERNKDTFLDKVENINFKDLYEEAQTLIKSTQNLFEIRGNINVLNDKFQNLMAQDVNSKKEIFVNSGEDEVNFIYNNPIVKEFKDLIKDYRNNLVEQKKKIDQAEEQNLSIKENLIDQLKNIIDQGKAPNEIIKEFKEIREKWNSCGRIPINKLKIITNTFNHHQKRFYDYLDLNREFRDIEYAKNLEEKKGLIQKLRALNDKDGDDIKKIYELRQIQKIWREEVGPVAKELKDVLFEEFNIEVKKIEEKYSKIKKIILEEESVILLKKRKILEDLKGKLESIHNLKNHTDFFKCFDEFEKMKNEFINLGNVPLAEKNSIWKDFREVQKEIIEVKNKYFKEFRNQQKDGENQKNELILKIDEIVNTKIQDWDVMKDIVIKLQKDWKNTAFVTRKKSDELWRKFIEKCDLFFERYNEFKEDNFNSLDENFVKKEIFLKELNIKKEEILKSENIVESVNELSEEWKSFGKVKKDKSGIENDFNNFIDGILEEKGIKKQEIILIKIKNRVKFLLEEGNEKLVVDEFFSIKRKRGLLEKDILQLENNIGLFGKINSDSKNNPMIESILVKIEKLKEDKNLLEYKEKYFASVLNQLNKKK